jgi:hypothetical protein
LGKPKEDDQLLKWGKRTCKLQALVSGRFWERRRRVF